MIDWRDDETFVIEGIEYVCRPNYGRFKSEAGRFCLLEPRAEVEQYEALISALEPKRIVEVGMYDGASAALFSELAQPEKLVTIDRRTEPSEALTHFIAARGFAGTLAPYCPVSQGNVARLREIMRDEFHGEPLDLVVDDASHFLDLTRTSFNTIFPHVRPGGMYVVEDWAWSHTAKTGPWSTTDQVPLTVFIFELILACANRPDVIAGVDVSLFATRVTRGPASLDPETFDISTCYEPHDRALVAAL